MANYKTEKYLEFQALMVTSWAEIKTIGNIRAILAKGLNAIIMIIQL